MLHYRPARISPLNRPAVVPDIPRVERSICDLRYTFAHSNVYNKISHRVERPLLVVRHPQTRADALYIGGVYEPLEALLQSLTRPREQEVVSPRLHAHPSDSEQAVQRHPVHLLSLRG